MRILYTKLKVTQTGTDLNIARTAQTQDGQEFEMEEKITLDGKESANSFFDGMVNKKSMVKWSADEKAMTITSTIIFNQDGNEVKSNVTETWDLSKLLGALTIESASTSPNGEFKDTYVFDKN